MRRFKVLFLVVFCLCSVSLKAHANECIDYLLQVANPAVASGRSLYVLLNSEPASNIDAQLKHYQQMKKGILSVKQLRTQVEQDFSSNCFRSKSLVREVYFFDDKNVLFSMHASGRPSDGFIKEYMQKADTLPESLDRLIADAEAKSLELKSQLQSAIATEKKNAEQTKHNLQLQDEELALLLAEKKKVDELKQQNQQKQASIQHKRAELSPHKAASSSPSAKSYPSNADID